MIRYSIPLLLILTGIEVSLAVGAVQLDLRGEATLSLNTSDIEPHSLQADLRYRPELMVEFPLGDVSEFSALGTGDLYWKNRFLALNDRSGRSDADVYRLWVRYAAEHFEIRLGRQKLSFGSATLLRPLIWFDSLDPRDPLQGTVGVDALLLRYYLVNNGNIWIWGLHGNEEPRGWEVLPTAQDTGEYGGRLQWPVSTGELAFTYHHRLADLAGLTPPFLTPPPEMQAREDRYALDGKWDLTVGLWFEAALIKQEHDLLQRPFRHIAAAGLDYTFDLGQGLTVLSEHLVAGASEEMFGAADNSGFTALSLRYPWNVLDETRVIFYRDWDADDLYSFLEWRRTYDRWSFFLMGFANPKETDPSPLLSGGETLAGNGLRILIAFNH